MGNDNNDNNTPETTIPSKKLAAFTSPISGIGNCTFVKNSGIGKPSVFLIQFPIPTCINPSGPIVSILEIKHAVIANGMFARNRIATTAANSD